MGGQDGNDHLHRFQQDELVARRHGVPFGHEHLGDDGRDGGGQRAGVGSAGGGAAHPLGRQVAAFDPQGAGITGTRSSQPNAPRLAVGGANFDQEGITVAVQQAHLGRQIFTGADVQPVALAGHLKGALLAVNV